MSINNAFGSLQDCILSRAQYTTHGHLLQQNLYFSYQDLDLLVVGNKLQLEASVDVRTENKKGRGKKITGLHVRTFAGLWSVSVLDFLLLI